MLNVFFEHSTTLSKMHVFEKFKILTNTTEKEEYIFTLKCYPSTIVKVLQNCVDPTLIFSQCGMHSNKMLQNIVKGEGHILGHTRLV